MNHKVLYYMSALLLFCALQTKQPSQPVAIDEYEKIMFEWTRTWAEVLQTVKAKHYQISSPDKAMVKALDAFVNGLDPHSNFLDSETYKSMLDMTKGEFFGIGIVINNTRKTKDKYLMVVETIADGPAEKAGIQQYDKIIEIEDKPLEGMTTEEATRMLKGEKGTKVTIKILRENATDLLTFTLTRDVVKDQQSLCFYIPSKDIYYLSLTMFAQNSAQQLATLLTKTQEQDPKGIVLDLRNNSGGLLTSALDIAGLFLDKGSVVATTIDNTGKQTEEYKTSRQPIANRAIPICLLINNYTASAAEILAGTLKYHADVNDQKNPLMIFLVGTTTFGKGSVQEIIPISNNSALKLTIALYFLPNNIPVQGVGIAPDIVVERCLPPTEQMTWLTESYGRENTLDNYIKVPQKNGQPEENVEKNKKKNNDDDNKNAKKRWQERVQKMLQQDNQLKEAINVLLLVDYAQKQAPDLITNRTNALTYLKQVHTLHDNLDVQEVTL